MIRTEEHIYDLKGTGSRMRALVNKYHSDTSELDDLTVEECFYYVARLPYIPDPEDGEYIQRPAYSMSSKAQFRDCDDKSILLGAMLKRRGIKFDFVAVAEAPDNEVHHVLIRAYDKKGNYCFLDATYPDNIFLEHNTFYKILKIG